MTGAGRRNDHDRLRRRSAIGVAELASESNDTVTSSTPITTRATRRWRKSAHRQVVRQYVYGRDLIGGTAANRRPWRDCGYNGHGSVRYLARASGAVTDTYTYDAFGNLVASVGSTPNDYMSPESS